MLKTSSLGLKAHRAADIPGLFCSHHAGVSSRGAAEARAEAGAVAAMLYHRELFG